MKLDILKLNANRFIPHSYKHMHSLYEELEPQIRHSINLNLKKLRMILKNQCIN